MSAGEGRVVGRGAAYGHAHNSSSSRELPLAWAFRRRLPSSIKALTKTLPSRDSVLLFAILVVAAFLRFYRVGLDEFKGDEAWWCIEATRVLSTGRVPLLGQDIGGAEVDAYLGPLLTYLVATVFLLFGASAEAGTLVVTVLNLVTVFLVYKIGSRLSSAKAGLIAALLMSFSPWLVVYSRKLWPQSVLPFFSSIIILSFYNGIKSHRKIWFSVLGLSLGCLLQLHPTAYLVVPVLLIWAAGYRVKPTYVLTVILGAAVAFSPVLLHDLSNNLQNTRNLFVAISDPTVRGASSFPSHLLEVFRLFYDLTGGTRLTDFYGDYPNSNLLDFLIIEPFLLLAFGAALLVRLARARKRSQDPWRGEFLVLTWLTVPLLLHLVMRGSLWAHYFIVFFPMPFLASAIFLCDQLPHYLEQVLRGAQRFHLHSVIIVGVLSLVLIHHSTVLYCFYSNVVTNDGWGEYGSALENKRRAVEYVVQDSAQDASNAIIDIAVIPREPYDFFLMIAPIRQHTESHQTVYYYIVEPLNGRLLDRRSHIIDSLERGGYLEKRTFGGVWVYKASLRV